MHVFNPTLPWRSIMTLTTTRLFSLSALAAAAVVSMQPAVAADVVVTRSEMRQAQSAAWTAADFASARPLTPQVKHLPAAVFDYNAAAAEAATSRSAISVNGSRGGADARHLRQVETLSLAARDMDSGLRDVDPQAVGTGGLHFTSTRTFPAGSDVTYPTRTVGKLYFRDPLTNLNYVCSGSMIKKGVVLTSGHCIHNGVDRFYTDFVFRPGLRNGVYPYGTWSNWVQGRTTTAWVTGGGGVPNTGDWATIVFAPDATGKRIGDYTGWLGYQSGTCSGRHQTTLGYPVNLDSGLQMHRSDSQANSYGSLNNCIWGTDMTGGSSGGPTVLNFQSAYTNSSALPLENNANRVVATVSWGYVDAGVKIQGGSIVDGVFGTMITNTCSANPGSC